MDVGPETERPRGWAHEVTVVWMDDAESVHEVRLSWADHDHLSGGSIPPSRVSAAVARVAGETLGRANLPVRFDVSTIRRMVGDMDERVQGLL